MDPPKTFPLRFLHLPRQKTGNHYSKQQRFAVRCPLQSSSVCVTLEGVTRVISLGRPGVFLGSPGRARGGRREPWFPHCKAARSAPPPRWLRTQQGRSGSPGRRLAVSCPPRPPSFGRLLPGPDALVCVIVITNPEGAAIPAFTCQGCLKCCTGRKNGNKLNIQAREPG